MSKNKKKFDLSHLIHDGLIKDGQLLYFVSDPNKCCKVVRQPNGEYKVATQGETMTLHSFAQKCLGQDPPDHASKWVRNQNGLTLYDLWHQGDYVEAA